MNVKEKIEKLIFDFSPYVDYKGDDILSEQEKMFKNAKECAIINVKNEYYWLREMLFELRACNTIANGKVYLARQDALINEEKRILDFIDKFSFEDYS